MADTVDLGSTAKAWGFESLQVHALKKGIVMSKVLVFCFSLSLCVSSFADLIEWRFPRLGNCHEGLAFSDGITGVLVWGGTNTINLTLGRADLWDHRGGYSWTPEQSYTNIVAAVQAGDTQRVLGLFNKTTPKGEPTNPYMLPLGRIVVSLKNAAELVRGELDPFTGLGRLYLADGKIIGLAMSKASRTFALQPPDGVLLGVQTLPSTEFPVYEQDLQPIGFERAKTHDRANGLTGGLSWKLPADSSVWVSWKKHLDGSLAVCTGRGETASLAKLSAFQVVCSESAAEWHDFWARSARVKVPDPVIQRIFDYGMYRFGAMTDPKGVPAGLQGPWLEDHQLVPWNGDYHFNINVQECYSPAFRGGHFDHLLPLFRMVLSWRDRLRENARLFVGIPDGYSLPHSVDDRGVCIGGFWTGTIDHGSTAWVAALMYRYVRYSRDVAFLRESAYDFMKGAMNVYLAMMEDREGQLALPLGPSPEFGDTTELRKTVGRNPSFQLALAHRLARDLIEAAAWLGEKPDSRWIDVEKRLPLVSADSSGILLFEGQRLTESHRHHSHMAALYPFDILDINHPSLSKTVQETYYTWDIQGTGLWTGWCVPWASILRTHMGHAVGAVGLLRAWDRYFCDEGHGSHHNSIHPGFTLFRNGRCVMQMDAVCAATTAVLELFVHEVNGKVEFFRGCPEEWRDVSFENIRLSDGTSASGSRHDGVIKITRSN